MYLGSFAGPDPSTDHFASWQTRLDAALTDEVEKQADYSCIDLPIHSFSTARSGQRPVPLQFSTPGLFIDDHTFVSPHSFSASMPSPRLCMENNCDRSREASPANPSHQVSAQMSHDAMLLSPLQATFADIKRGSIGLQSWSRYSAADVALPALRPRQSIDSSGSLPAVSRRNSVVNPLLSFADRRQSSNTFDDAGLFSQGLCSANPSIHSIVSPTLQIFRECGEEAKGEEHHEGEADVFHFGRDFLEQAQLGMGSGDGAGSFETAKPLSMLQWAEEEEEVDQLASDQEEEENDDTTMKQDQDEEMIDLDGSLAHGEIVGCSEEEASRSRTLNHLAL